MGYCHWKGKWAIMPLFDTVKSPIQLGGTLTDWPEITEAEAIKRLAGDNAMPPTTGPTAPTVTHAGYHWVNGYTKKNGTVVSGHWARNP